MYDVHFACLCVGLYVYVRVYVYILPFSVGMAGPNSFKFLGNLGIHKR